jgi:hypothetical protein
MASTSFQLHRDRFGKLVLTTPEGEQHVGVAPVRSFRIQANDEGIALVRDGGKEVAWIDKLAELPEQILVTEELEGREFIPEILHIKDVSSFATPCTWFVTTDRGDTEFV